MKTIQHKFVESVPEILEHGVLYVCIQYHTAVHACVCGCGNKVITPIQPNGWTLLFDGKTISLYPSIGNWHLPCRSHYWIKKDRIEMAAPWPEKKNSKENKGKKRKSKKDKFNVMGEEKIMFDMKGLEDKLDKNEN